VVRGWTWDETLFRGSAPYYVRGRIPYPAGLHDAFAGAAEIPAGARLLDVGCGPGVVALTLADLFAEVVGVDPDGEMLAEAERRAASLGIGNVSWAHLRAEELPAGLGRFRYATFAQSFHWMDREVVSRAMFGLVVPGGAVVHLDSVVQDPAAAPASLPFPRPPDDEIGRLRERYLGSERRAGQGVLRFGTPDDEEAVLQEAGFEAPVRVRVVGRTHLERSIDDVVAQVFSGSGSAPHLFGDRVDEFERELRALLETAADEGRFSAWQGDVDLVFYRRPDR
jgi:ubiquinone/menaquinone biosynthesis C-methylase UbiE